MIQLNLLPDVKLEYIKAQRTRRLVMSLSFLVTAAAVGLVVLLLFFNAVQSKHLHDLSKDIERESKELSSKPQINKILTVQNQLNSLPDLHAKKPAATRIFDYLNQITPSAVSISSFNTDLTTQTATVTGNADSLSSVNKFVDTLKYTTFAEKGDDSKAKAFSNVVMTTFGVNTGGDSAKAANYAITFSYDAAIFDISKDISLTVPKITTTRAVLDAPSELFQSQPNTTAKSGGQ